MRVVIDWHYTPAEKTAYGGQLRAEGDIERIMLEHDLQQPLSVAAKGEIVFGQTPHAVLTGSNQAMQWPFESDRPLIKADTVTVVLEGWSDNYNIAVDANFSGESLPASQLHGRATGNMEFIEIVSLFVTSADNTLNAKGQGRITLEANPDIDAGIEVSLGENRLKVHGKPGRTLDLAWQLYAPALKDFHSSLTGRLDGRGRIHGKWVTPVLTGELSGNRISYNDYSLQALKIHAKAVSLDPATRSQLVVNASQFRFGDETIEQFVLKVNGNPESHQVQVTAANNSLSLKGDLSGAYRDKVWDGRLVKGNLTSAWFGTWVSDAPTGIKVSSSAINVARSCWHQDSASLCLQSDWRQTGGIAAAADLGALPLNMFDKLLPGDSQLQGLLNAKLIASGPLQELQVDINANASDGAILIALGDGEFERHGWRELSLQANALSNEWQIDTAMTLEQAGYIKAGLAISPLQNLNGQVSIELEDLAWAGLFTPQLRNLNGQLKINGGIGGTLKQPEFELKGRLHNGYAEIPELGIALKEIELQASSVSKHSIALNGTLRSGDGHLQLVGQLADPLLGNRQLKLQVSGQNFEIVKLPVVHATISPDLSMQMKAMQLSVTGTILVPKVNMEIETLPASAVRVSSDAVVINSDQSVTLNKDRFSIVSDVKLVLGEDVHFRGFGFDTALDGTLDISEKLNQPTQAYGELRVREGSYKAYGQKLKLESGRLIFRGPYDNPALAIRAVRQTADATVGLDIGGTLKKPSSHLFSNPSLPESEAMAILLTGKSTSSASEADAGMLLQAVVSLGVEQGPAITGQLARTFRLDVITIDSESDLNQSSLLLGKYLTPRLYVRYAVGLFDQSNSVGLEYKLNNSFKLEAQSGVEQSMDLIYRIER
jgi:translocation and assembly module TamB